VESFLGKGGVERGFRGAEGSLAAVGVAGGGMLEQAPPSMQWNSAHAAAGELVWLPHLLLCVLMPARVCVCACVATHNYIQQFVLCFAPCACV